MKIRWRGHASFFIEAAGMRIITDPFAERVGYPLTLREADIVTCSHNHYDHNATDTLLGQPELIKEITDYTIAEITIKGFTSYHDQNEGKSRGKNTIYKITAEGISILHLGDLGHILSEEQLQDIGVIDILMVPVGGNFTVDAEGAYELVKLLAPHIVLPMHYHTPHVTIKLEPVEKFLSQYNRVIKKPFLEVKREDLEGDMKIMVLDYLSS